MVPKVLYWEAWSWFGRRCSHCSVFDGMSTQQNSNTCVPLVNQNLGKTLELKTDRMFLFAEEIRELMERGNNQLYLSEFNPQGGRWADEVSNMLTQVVWSPEHCRLKYMKLLGNKNHAWQTKIYVLVCSSFCQMKDEALLCHVPLRPEEKGKLLFKLIMVIKHVIQKYEHENIDQSDKKLLMPSSCLSSQIVFHLVFVLELVNCLLQ